MPLRDTNAVIVPCIIRCKDLVGFGALLYLSFPFLLYSLKLSDVLYHLFHRHTLRGDHSPACLPGFIFSFMSPNGDCIALEILISFVLTSESCFRKATTSTMLLIDTPLLLWHKSVQVLNFDAYDLFVEGRSEEFYFQSRIFPVWFPSLTVHFTFFD